MSPTWSLRRPDAGAVERLARQKSLSRVAAGLLVSRGHTAPDAVEAHLRASPMDLHDPFLLPGMEAATERLTRALRDRETILIHGDYDVDGVTGTALLVRLLRHLDARVEWHIPNRLVDGYSFGEHSLERAAATGATVVVSVDNGTSAHETIGQLAERGVDTVVTDHHEAPPGPLPEAAAIVNPKLPGSSYPWRELCGGAVAFKLAWGLCQRVGNGARGDLKAFLEEATAYVAIATVCDVVPLLDENRIFARFGLKALATTKSPGLAALVEIAGLGGRALDAEDVGFQIGPRINASGRLGSAAQAVELLLATEAEHARALASSLDELNGARKRLEREVLEEARRQATDFADEGEHPVLVLAGEGWHQGVVGIVAARLVEELHRPAIVIGLDGELGRGSARTVDGFDALEALRGGAAHLSRFGGHTQAAGCELAADRVDALRAAVCARARAMTAENGLPTAQLAIDCELSLARVGRELMTELARLEPYGAGNEKPVFLARDARLEAPPQRVGATGDHLVLRLRRDSAAFKGVAFGRGGAAQELRKGQAVDVAYTPRWNVFRGERSLELLLHDFRAP